MITFNINIILWEYHVDGSIINIMTFYPDISNLDIKLPSGNFTYLCKIAIEIVDFSIEHADVPQFCQSLPEGKSHKIP